MKFRKADDALKNTPIAMRSFCSPQKKMFLYHPRYRQGMIFDVFVFLFTLFFIAFYTTAAGHSVHFAIIGDYGCGCPGQMHVAAVLKRLHLKDPIDAILTTGDNIYGQASYSPLKHFMFWRKKGGDRALFKERFDRFFLPLIQNGVRFHAVLGNHDYRTRQARDLIHDERRFGIPNDRGYYRLVFGGTPDQPLVEILMLNSVRLKRGDPDQIFWIKHVLQKSRAPWRMVFLHHPLYGPTGNHRPDAALRRMLERIFRKYSVQLLFSGHNHFYARVHPSAKMIQFVVGNGGAPIHKARPDANTRCLIMRHGFLSLHVTLNQILFRSYTAEGVALDEGVLVRSSNRFVVESQHCRVRYQTTQ